jgi:Asp-tRNA(Asn)/Glu-tRNA(Gln) amidotransferase A subunit family amidase
VGVLESMSLHAAITSARSLGFGPEVQRRLLCGNFVLSASAYES